MSPRVLMFLFCMLTLLGTVHQAASAETALEEAQAAIQANYDAIDNAEQSLAPDGIVSYVSADAVIVDKNGKQHPGGELHSMLASVLRNADTVETDTTLGTLTLNADGATVTVTRRVTVTLKAGENDKADVIVSETTARDFWVHMSTNWLLLREKILTDKTLVNDITTTIVRRQRDIMDRMPDLAGLWVAHTDDISYLVTIAQPGKHVIATRRGGGELGRVVLWEGDVKPIAFPCKQQMKVNGRMTWVKSRAEIADNNHFTLSTSDSQSLSFTRVVP